MLIVLKEDDSKEKFLEIDLRNTLCEMDYGCTKKLSFASNLQKVFILYRDFSSYRQKFHCWYDVIKSLSS